MPATESLSGAGELSIRFGTAIDSEKYGWHARTPRPAHVRGKLVTFLGSSPDGADDAGP
jgi:hypothetical protein